MSILDTIISAIKSLLGGVMPRSHDDVLALLAKRAEGRPGLDWHNSIVDLLKLLELDSGFEARKKLADEVGYESYAGTTEQNLRLHERVMDKIRHRELG